MLYLLFIFACHQNFQVVANGLMFWLDIIALVLYTAFEFFIYHSVLAKRLAGKSISEMTYFVPSGTSNLNSVN